MLLQLQGQFYIEMKILQQKMNILPLKTDGFCRVSGACSGCPSSQATLKGGIEGMLMHYIPEVEGVREVFEEESAAVPLSFKPQPVDSF